MSAAHRWQCHSVGLNSGLLTIVSVRMSGMHTPIWDIGALLALRCLRFPVYRVKTCDSICTVLYQLFVCSCTGECRCQHSDVAPVRAMFHPLNILLLSKRCRNISPGRMAAYLIDSFRAVHFTKLGFVRHCSRFKQFCLSFSVCFCKESCIGI
jgi:hypothetical protein